MFLTRHIGSILRGNSTPFQILAACILASMLAFVPGFKQAPGLLVTLIVLIIVVNGNLTLSVQIGILAKLVSIPLVPVSFAIGRFLLDGPLQGFFKTMVNSPVLAFFGFEYYLVAGGQVVGLVFGILAGVVCSYLVTAFRKKMVSLEESSEKYKKWAGNFGVKMMTWIFLGGTKKKKSYDEFIGKKVGNPVRPLGIVFVLFVGGLCYCLSLFFKGPILTAALREGLERANGATVDVKSAKVDFKKNRLTVKGLAVADANNLEIDLVRAAKLEADINTKDLLRKRVKLDQVLISEATTGEKRKRPGVHVGPPPKVSEPPPSDDPNQKTIDDYFEQAMEIKERLAKLKEWIEGVSGDKEEEVAGDSKSGESKGSGKGSGAPDPSDKDSQSKGVAKQVEQYGHAWARALHLLEESPTFMVGEIVAEKVQVKGLEDETLDIRARNLSTHPWLVVEEKEVVVKSEKGTVGGRISLGGAEDAAANGNEITFHYRGIQAEEILKGIKMGGNQPVQGGTIDITAQGAWRKQTGDMVVEMPVVVTLNDAKIEIPQIGQANLGSVELPIVLRGPLDNPRIKVETKQVVSAVKDAAVGGVKQLAKEKAAGLLQEHLGDKIPGGLLNSAGGQGLQLPNLGGENGLNLPGGLFQKPEGGEQQGQTSPGLQIPQIGGKNGLQLPGGLFGQPKPAPAPNNTQPQQQSQPGQGLQIPKIGGENGIQLPEGLFQQPAPTNPQGQDAPQPEQPKTEDAVKGLLNNFLNGE